VKILNAAKAFCCGNFLSLGCYDFVENGGRHGISLLVLKMASSREDHRDTMAIAGSNDFVVTF
jgi:hypothetical protein